MLWSLDFLRPSHLPIANDDIELTISKHLLLQDGDVYTSIKSRYLQQL